MLLLQLPHCALLPLAPLIILTEQPPHHKVGWLRRAEIKIGNKIDCRHCQLVIELSVLDWIQNLYCFRYIYLYLISSFFMIVQYYIFY